MSTVALTQLINAPAAELWRIFTDLPARPEWLCTVTAVTVLTPGAFGAGTSWRERRILPDGCALTEEFLVVSATPPTELTVVSTGDGAHYRTTYTFTELPPGRCFPRWPTARPYRGADIAGTAGIAGPAGTVGPASTAVHVVQNGVPTAAYGRLLALILGGLAARAVEGALRRDLADLAAVATGGGPASIAA